jgi:crotonobetainyl-CoA:carnitine CoA-transferase CaiB-like acyl-CoA transferase
MSDDALAGIRVLDLTRLMPFSYGTQLLADAGADVVKVEPPGGEYGRGMHATFRLTNRGKRSIELDLRNPEGVVTLLELVAGADVLVESFRPGVLERAGVGFAAASKVNPRLVYVSVSGYAAKGPRAHAPGHDLTYAAIAGLLALDGRAPSFPTTPFVDLAAGWGLAASVMLGVIAAARTGVGSHRTVSMADMAFSMNVLGIAAVNTANQSAAPTTATGPLAGYPWPELMLGDCPCYGIVTTSDGRHLALANVEPKFWSAFVTALGRPDFEPDRFALGERSRVVRAEIQLIIGSGTRDEWVARFDTVDVCVSDVHTPAGAVEDPEFAPLISDADGEIVVASPLSRGRGPARGESVPEPGQHQEEVLREFGVAQREQQGRGQ